MRPILCLAGPMLFVTAVLAELPELPLSDTRLSVGNLIREDIFAGWRSGDMQRFARAEENIERLLEQRPGKRAELLAWKGGTKLYRAILALESNQIDEFERLYQEVLDLNEQARRVGPKDIAVSAIIGGGYVVFGDRLPENHRAAAWSACYDGYQRLWASQQSVLAKLPIHVRGELLAGLILSTQRLDRTAELNEYLDKAIEVLPGTRYATIAQQWKDDPTIASTANLTCIGCHAEGRLARRIKQFEEK